MGSKLIKYFNKMPKLCAFASADKKGKVNVAVFGSAMMVNEQTVIMGMMENRTIKNLQENPEAVFMIMEPGDSLAAWKGIRIYMKVKQIETSGETLAKIKAAIEQAVGKEPADATKYAVTLEPGEIRPIVDMGQSWEQSI